MKRACILTLAAAAVAISVPAVAGGPGQWLASSDWHRWLDTGPSQTTQVGSGLRAEGFNIQDFGVQELGGRDSEFESAPMAEEKVPGNTGKKLAAGGLSLLIPGLGQFYNGDTSKGLVMLGVEVVIWGAYIGFNNHASTLQGDSRNWAGIYADARGDHPDNFWQAVGRYDDSDGWFDSQLREARAFGETAPPPLTDDEYWQWRNEGYREDYQKLRADANSAYDNRDLMILFAILNRAVSIFDAVRNGGVRSDEPAVGARILGAEVALEISRPLPRPEARAVASWSF